MFGTLTRAGLISVTPNIPQIGRVAQTPTATPEQQVHVSQVPGVVPIQPVNPIRPEVRPEASEKEKKRLERFKKYDTPTFSGTTTEDAQGFLENCHRILRTMGIVEVSGVTFTTFQLSGAAYRWWQIYEEDIPTDATPPTWAQFSEMFVKEFVS